MKIMFLMALPFAAQAQQVGTEFLISSDSEGFEAHKISAEYFPADLGVRASHYRYGDNQFTKTGQRLTAVGRFGDWADGYSFDAGVAQQSGHKAFVGDGSYRRKFGATGVEVFASRDWVETRRALEAGVLSTFVGVAIDQPVGDHFTLVGVVGRQVFTDGNDRNHGRARLVYQPMLDVGLTVQYRYRAYSSADKAVTYFNPRDYDEHMLALGYRHRVAGWTVAGTAGIGKESVNKQARQPTRLLEFNVQSPAKGPYVQFRAGLTKAASFGGSNYTYRYAAGEIVVPF